MDEVSALSCVGVAVPAFAMTDLDSAVRCRIPDKRATVVLLDRVLKWVLRPRAGVIGSVCCGTQQPRA